MKHYFLAVPLFALSIVWLGILFMNGKLKPKREKKKSDKQYQSHCFILNFTTLWPNSTDNKLMIFFVFYTEYIL